MELQSIVYNLNVAFKDSLVRFETGEIRSTIEIKLVENEYIDREQISPTKAFYIKLDEELQRMGHGDYELNNTKRIIIV